MKADCRNALTQSLTGFATSSDARIAGWRRFTFLAPAVVLSFFLLCVSTFAGTRDGLVFDRYLNALALIESGGNQQAKGGAGERGAWQIKPEAWRYASALRQRLDLEVHPFAEATNPEVARAYVRTLVEDHGRRFTMEFGRAPTPQELYAIWNLGFDGFQRRGSLAECPAMTRDAAQRLVNLLKAMGCVPGTRTDAATPPIDRRKAGV